MHKENLSKLIINELGWKKSSYREGWYICPFHNDKNPSLHVDYEGGVYHCFGCNKGGRLEDVFFAEKKMSAYKYFEINKPAPKKKQVTKQISDNTIKFEEIPEVNLDISKGMIPAENSVICIDYIKSRGLPESVLKEYGMYFCQDVKVIDKINMHFPEENRTTEFKDMIAIPIYEQGKLLSLEARTVLPKPENIRKESWIKALYPRGSSKDTLFDYEKLEKFETLYLVEGLMDLIALRTHPKFKNSTCIFGAGISKRQMWLLNKFMHIFYLIDNDSAGHNSLLKLSENYKGRLDFAVCPAGCKDVGDILDPNKLNSTIEAELKKGWLKRFVPVNYVSKNKIEENKVEARSKIEIENKVEVPKEKKTFIIDNTENKPKRRVIVSVKKKQ